MELLSKLDPMLQMFWYIAIPVSVIFIIQTIITFVGMDSSDGASADFNGDLDGDAGVPFQLFSFRNLVNFLLGFGWGGISFYGLFEQKSLVVVMALLAGFLLIAIFFLVMKQMNKLNENNTMNAAEAIGKTAEVYLSVPASGGGMGKVLVSVRGSMHELSVVTKGEAIPSGSLVRIKGLESDEILIVEKI